MANDGDTQGGKAMTNTLREIALRYVNNPVGKQVQTDIATLLKAVVEVEAKVKMYHRLRALPVIRTPEGIPIVSIQGKLVVAKPTEEDRTQALCELDLDKVWPVKEER